MKGGEIMMLHLSSPRVWDPLESLAELSGEMDRLFGGDPASAFPVVKVDVQENQATVTAEIPGVQADQLDIRLEGNRLTLAGERPAAPAEPNATVLRRERFAGAFERTLALPFRVDADKVEAVHERGVLMVTLPRADADKPRKIAVKSA
jgi:HSP20 family protein